MFTVSKAGLTEFSVETITLSIQLSNFRAGQGAPVRKERRTPEMLIMQFFRSQFLWYGISIDHLCE